MPVAPKGKRPITPNGCYDGTTDPAIIDGWKNDPRYANCNWGIWCKDLFVIDVDGDKGKESLNRLVEELGEPPVGPVVHTGGGGLHFFYKKPKGELTAKVDKSLHIDIRTGGTIVVAPGSIHNNGYTYGESATNPLVPIEELPELPEVWLNRLQEKPKKEPLPAPVRPAIMDGDYSDAERWVDQVRTKTEGDGGEALMTVCNALFWEWGFDRNDYRARAILDSYNSKVTHNDGTPYPWSPSEIEHKIDSVFSKPPHKPFGHRRRENQLKEAQNVSTDFTVNGRGTEEPPKEKDSYGLALLRGDEIEMTPETWLWEDRIPLGHFSNVFGVGGIGKSAIVFDWAARVTSGKEWEDGKPNKVGSVLYFSMEQDEVDARAKLELWGGNIKNFYIVRGTWRRQGKIEIFDLSQLGELRYTLQAFRDNPDVPDIRLIVIDPVISAMGKIKDSSQSDIRNMLEPVRPTLKEFEVACVYICHSRKPTVNFKEASKDRCAGSQAFTSVARVSYEVIEDSEGNEHLPAWEVPRVMLCAKRNGAVLPKGIIYNFTEPVARPELMNRKLSTIHFIDHSVDMMMDTYSANKSKEAASEKKPRKSKDDSTDVEDWLLDLLADGPKEVGHSARNRTPHSLCAMGEPFGYLYWKIRKAKDNLIANGHPIESTTINGKPGWRLVTGAMPTIAVPREPDEQDNLGDID